MAKAGITDLQSNAVTKVLTKLDVAVGRFLLNKQETSKTKFDSVAGAGRQFLKDLATEFPGADVSVYADLWPLASLVPEAAPGTEATAVDANAIRLVTLDDATGEVTEARGRLRAAGFDVGSVVARRDIPGQILKVSDVSGDVACGKVRLEKLPVVTDQPPEIVEVPNFLKNFMPAEAKDVVERHPGWPRARCSHVVAGKTLRAKGTILTALGALGELLDEAAPMGKILEVHTKPLRRVVTTCSLQVAGIQLVPETMSVKSLTDKEFADLSPDEATRLLEVVLTPPCQGHRFFLASATGNEAMGAA